MQASNDGLTIWSGSDDTAATGFLVRAGMAPAGVSNLMRLHYRGEDGLPHTLQGQLLADTSNDAQYYQFTLPRDLCGTEIQIQLEGACTGRTVRGPWQSYHLPDQAPERSIEPHANAHTIPEPVERIPYHMEYLCKFHIYLGRGPEIIGATPEGIKVNWYPTSGECRGPKLNALLRPEGGDWMTIRPDGVGILGVRGTLQTDDGALIYATYSGVFELGENGYENFLQHKYPKAPPTRTTPMFITAHPDYLWINRLQCVGIGIVHMDKLMYEYDMYALR